MRELIYGVLEYRGKPKDDPYNEGKKQVGMKFTFDDGVQEWVNAKPDAPWIKGIKKGSKCPFVKEWSGKKKDKETGKEGAYAYRPILVQGAESGCDAKLAGQVLELFRWLARAPEGEKRSPMRALLTEARAHGHISEQEFKCYGSLFVVAGQVFRLLSGEAQNNTARQASPKPKQQATQAPKKVNWNDEVLKIESRLQLAYEDSAGALEEAIAAIDPSQYPGDVGRRVRAIINSFATSPA